MHSQLIASGIRFNDCFFTEPVRLSDWTPPKFPGLFVILACDSNWAPRSFQPLFFGEFGNNSPYALKECEVAGLPGMTARRNLFVSMLAMPFSTGGQRTALRGELVSSYHPALQGTAAGSAPEELANRIDEMEKRHREQTAQVLLLLGNLNKQFEPQPVPQRRRIGFLTEAPPENNTPATESRTY
ncbi:MAG TPA: hypothetical protein VGH38_22870 [Bryobacteraceae bacterium]|jgi:hypothetical protein